MTAFLIIAGWLACLPLSYLMFRRAVSRGFDVWTCGDRSLAIFLSVFGPLSILTSAIMFVMPTAKDWSRKANW